MFKNNSEKVGPFKAPPIPNRRSGESNILRVVFISVVLRHRWTDSSEQPKTLEPNPFFFSMAVIERL